MTRTAPRVILLLGVIGAAVTAIPALLLTGDAAVAFDSVQQLVACLAAIGALVVAAREGGEVRRRVCVGLAAGIAMAAAGLALWDADPSSTTNAPGDLLLVAAVVSAVAAMVPGLFRGLDRLALVGVALDTILLFLMGYNLVSAVWWSHLASDRPEAPAFLASVVLIAGSGAGTFALVARRAQPYAGGPWAVLAGLLVCSISWASWLVVASAGPAPGVIPTDFLVPVGILLVAHGGSTWHVTRSSSEGYERLADSISGLFPILAIVISVGLDVAVPRETAGLDVIAIGTGGVVLAAAARQLVLLRRERRARMAEAAASLRLTAETRERADTVVSLARLEPADTPEETARRICAEALKLDGIDLVVMHAWTRKGVVPLAVLTRSGERFDIAALPDDRSEAITVRSAGGPWAEIIDPARPDPKTAPLAVAGLRGTANAGLHWNDRMVGAIGVGTLSEDVARTLDQRLPTVQEFSVVAAALLGPALVAREHTEEVRDSIQATIDAGAFHPVFQPVVDLDSGRMVGFESLTRFADGVRPDVRFSEAASAGMTVPLEMATIRAAFRDAARLPDGAWLSVNVSPALATALIPIISILEGMEREIVVEITEHVEVDDYARLADALALLRGRARIAVDDAGAGYAGLRHILELRPEFVKLDIALVRAIDSDPARRAMVGSMARFAQETGASLIAEGIETTDELRVLRDLGVGFGQGYLLARPDVASAFGGPARISSAHDAPRARVRRSRRNRDAV